MTHPEVTLFMQRSMNCVRGSQGEGRYLDVELVSARAGHLIGASHHARGSLERAPRRVLERLSRRKNRLLADHSRPPDFFDMVQRIGDDPMPGEELNRFGSLIRDAHRVFEYRSE